MMEEEVQRREKRKGEREVEWWFCESVLAFFCIYKYVF